MRKVMEDALARARHGDGPTVVEAVTYRLSDHTTADDASRYRPAAELEAAWQREPLLRTRRYLEQRGFWDEAREAALRTQCMEQIDAAVQAYQNRPAATTDHMFEHLFAHPPAGLAEQKDIARRYRADPH
jgi:pyruvate dehydrogenase E1 component alpha subunit